MRLSRRLGTGALAICAGFIMTAGTSHAIASSQPAAEHVVKTTVLPNGDTMVETATNPVIVPTPVAARAVRSAASAHVVKTTTLPDGNTLVESVSDPVVVPMPTAARRTLSAAAVGSGTCELIGATTGYNAPVGQLWWFRSTLVWCFTKNEVTYMDWQTPQAHVNDPGVLAGWHYTGYNHNKNWVNLGLRTGNSTGHFKQYYSALGQTVQVGSQDAVQHVWIGAGGAYGWS